MGARTTDKNRSEDFVGVDRHLRFHLSKSVGPRKKPASSPSTCTALPSTTSSAPSATPASRYDGDLVPVDLRHERPHVDVAAVRPRQSAPPFAP